MLEKNYYFLQQTNIKIKMIQEQLISWPIQANFTKKGRSTKSNLPVLEWEIGVASLATFRTPTAQNSN